jgi:hypothetical protein
VSEHGRGAGQLGADSSNGEPFDPERTVGRTPSAPANGGFDPETTIGGDADLLAEVRSAVEAARRGLAAPPPRSDDESAPAVTPPPAAPPTAAPGLPPPVVGRDALPPPTAVAPATTETVGGGATPTAGPPRWIPPARLKPAATPAPTAFLDPEPPKRNRTPWLIAAGVAVLALVGTGIALAVRGGGTSPTDDSTVSVPASGASVPVTTAAPTTSAAPTTVRVSTTVAPATTAAPTTTLGPTTTAAPVTEPPTIAAPPPETVLVETAPPEAP